MPAYVVKYKYLGANFLALVNGANGYVGGERHYSALKIGGLAGFTILSSAAFTGIDLVPSLVLSGLASIIAGMSNPTDSPIAFTELGIQP